MTQPTPPAQGEPPKQDIYEKYGISKVGADGKPKTENQLYKELHAAQLAEIFLDTVRPGDAVMIKGSLASGMAPLAEAVSARFPKAGG